MRADSVEEAEAYFAGSESRQSTGAGCAGVGILIDADAELQAPLGFGSLADSGTVPERRSRPARVISMAQPASPALDGSRGSRSADFE